MKDPCVLPREGETTHELKCWPKPFQAVVSGDKRHEVRKNDRCFRVGDKLLLREWKPETQEYTGQKCLATITYITEGGTWGIPSDLCILSVKVDSWHLPHRDAITD